MSRPHITSLGRTHEIMIVDDHPLVREGLNARLSAQADLRVTAEADSVDTALQRIKDSPPDALIIDIALESSNGLELIEQVHSRYPRIKMLVVSAYEEMLYAERSLRAGAQGYVNKKQLQDDVVVALRTILRGDRYLSPQMSQRVLEQLAARADNLSEDPVKRLSNRELQVFQMIGEGLATGSIAAALHLSVHTIDTHREKIRYKLGLRTGAELIRRAVQWNLENR